MSDISVAVIEPVGGHGGMDFYDLGLCRGLLASGCRVSLYTCDETADPGIANLGFYPFYRSVYGQGNRWARGLRYLKGTFDSLWNAVSSGERICHFHTFNDVIADLLVVALARLFGRKVVLTVHDVDSLAGPVRRKKRLAGWVYRLANQIIVHNKVSLRELESFGVPPVRVNVIPFGDYFAAINEIPSTAEARDALDIEASARVVLFFGQIKEAKGLDILIEALPTVAHAIPEVVLLIAGRPWKTEFGRYDTLIDDLKLRARCRLHIGFVPDDQVAMYYAAADVVALPYRRIYQSGVLMMAMSYGRPVLVSDLPGMKEIVADGVNGYVFAQGSKDDLAKVLIGALQDETGSRQVAERASEYIREHHSWTRIGQKTAELYQAVLSTSCTKDDDERSVF